MSKIFTWSVWLDMHLSLFVIFRVSLQSWSGSVRRGMSSVRGTVWNEFTQIFCVVLS